MVPDWACHTAKDCLLLKKLTWFSSPIFVLGVNKQQVTANKGYFLVKLLPDMHVEYNNKVMTQWVQLWHGRISGAAQGRLLCWRLWWPPGCPLTLSSLWGSYQPKSPSD